MRAIEAIRPSSSCRHAVPCSSSWMLEFTQEGELALLDPALPASFQWPKGTLPTRKRAQFARRRSWRRLKGPLLSDSANFYRHLTCVKQPRPTVCPLDGLALVVQSSGSACADHKIRVECCLGVARSWGQTCRSRNGCDHSAFEPLEERTKFCGHDRRGSSWGLPTLNLFLMVCLSRMA